jgi:hypothetical protein
MLPDDPEPDRKRFLRPPWQPGRVTNPSGTWRRGTSGNPLAGLRPWKPGQTGNTLGRASSALGLAGAIRRLTGDGAELVAFHLKVLRGEVFKRPGRRTALVPDLTQRQASAAWLSDRAFGRSREIVELVGEDPAEQRLALLRRMPEADREALRAIVQRALAAQDAASMAPTPANGHAEGEIDATTAADGTDPNDHPPGVTS